MNKICTKCGSLKPEEDFYWRNKAKGIRRTECKECNKLWQKKTYNKNKEIVLQAKEKGCQKCGEKRHYVIDMHHIDPSQKDEEVCKILRCCSYERLLQELQKCIPLCSNCHREFHYLEKEQQITIEKYLQI